MLKELLGVVEKTNTRPLLFTFGGLSMITLPNMPNLLADPLSWNVLLLLPFSVCLAYGLVIGWILFVQGLNSRLAPNDMASWGPMIGCSILAFCLLVVFSYLSVHPQGVSFAILADPNFIRTSTLLLLAVETIKIQKRRT